MSDKRVARKLPISTAFAARYANGNPNRRTVGFAQAAVTPNFSTRAAECAGTLLALAAAARVAAINGAGRPA
jgi:hypothetical protein